MQVEDIWDETERVWPLFQGIKEPQNPASIFEQASASETNGAEEKDDDDGLGEDSDAPLHFNLSDPDQIRQYCKQLLWKLFYIDDFLQLSTRTPISISRSALWHRICQRCSVRSRQWSHPQGQNYRIYLRHQFKTYLEVKVEFNAGIQDSIQKN